VLIIARVKNGSASHEVMVATAGASKAISVAAKPSGQGSVVNGGEFLMLALATCYCNDIYREAARLKVEVTAVEVEASAEFGAVGLSAKNIRYRARVSSPAPEAEIANLLHETDAVAEVHNTIRSGANVSLVPWDAVA
jgi:organic hydroperoxide reductase OsmC/OhrA